MHLFLTNTLDTCQPIITGSEHHHLTRVLRLQPGDRILMTSGCGSAAEAVIDEIGRYETRCSVKAVHEEFNEPRVAVILLHGVLKNPGKMDWLVEKGTELGMTSFMPLYTKRTISKSVKTTRLRNIAETATKQTLRGRIPTVFEPRLLAEVLASLVAMPEYNAGGASGDAAGSRDAQNLPAGLKRARLLLFHEGAPADAVPEALEFDDRPLAMFIGPEGGFSDEEVTLLRGRGAEVLSLGPRRLRGETAGVAALARIAARVER